MQYELVRKWSRGGKLFVIGDPDQSIYSFRGAAAECFEKLKGDFPAVAEVRLTESYRSTPQILGCALSAIAANGGEHTLLPVKGAGPAVRVAECASELSEGIFISKEIARMVGGLDMLGKGREEKVRTFGEIAVLARTHRMLRVIEQCLRREGIPCLLSGEREFLEAPEVSGTLAFFGTLCGGKENAQAEEWMGGKENFSRAKELFLPQLHIRPRKLLAAWREYMHIQSRAFDQLIDAARYADLPDFLRAMQLGTEGDVSLPVGNTDGGAVRLTTLHGAKGLEFPAVFFSAAQTKSCSRSRRPVQRTYGKREGSSMWASRARKRSLSLPRVEIVPPSWRSFLPKSDGKSRPPHPFINSFPSFKFAAGIFDGRTHIVSDRMGGDVSVRWSKRRRARRKKRIAVLPVYNGAPSARVALYAADQNFNFGERTPFKGGELAYLFAAQRQFCCGAG